MQKFIFLYKEIARSHLKSSITKLLLISNIFYIFATPFLFENILDALPTSIFLTSITIINIAPIYMTYAENGYILQLKTILPSYAIIFAQFVSMFLLCLFAFAAKVFLLAIFYNLKYEDIILFSKAEILIITLSIVSGITSYMMKIYFSDNNEHISMIMLPIIFPAYICVFCILNAKMIFAFDILLGMNLVISPIMLYFASYLLNNI